MWSCQDGPDNIAAWTKIREIKLHIIIPIPITIGMPPVKLSVVGFVKRARIIYVNSDANGIYALDLKSGRQGRSLRELSMIDFSLQDVLRSW